MGRTAKFPRNAMAFKWTDETAETTLREIEWSASRTGLINPVAVFDPVELEGTQVSRASVHNISIVESLKEEGRTIIMVGDGINDSPALAAADVSVSMKNSSDIAREVADVSLLSDNLYDLITLRKLSVGMLNKIDTNYHSIIGINGSLIALGMFGIITPSTSSLIHNLSTMLLGALSTRSVLKEPREIEVNVVETA